MASLTFTAQSASSDISTPDINPNINSTNQFISFADYFYTHIKPTDNASVFRFSNNFKTEVHQLTSNIDSNLPSLYPALPSFPEWNPNTDTDIVVCKELFDYLNLISKDWPIYTILKHSTKSDFKRRLSNPALPNLQSICGQKLLWEDPIEDLADKIHSASITDSERETLIQQAMVIREESTLPKTSVSDLVIICRQLANKYNHEDYIYADTLEALIKADNKLDRKLNPSAKSSSAVGRPKLKTSNPDLELAREAWKQAIVGKNKYIIDAQESLNLYQGIIMDIKTKIRELEEQLADINTIKTNLNRQKSKDLSQWDAYIRQLKLNMATLKLK
jgi:hypothetical protein